MEQGYEVTGLYFTSAFSKSYGKEKLTPAAVVSRAIGIDLRVMDLGQDYIDLITGPEARLRKEHQSLHRLQDPHAVPGDGRSWMSSERLL